MDEAPWWHRPCRILMPGLDRQLVRLDAEVEALGIRLAQAAAATGDDAAARALQRAREFQRLARRAAGRCDVEGGWRAVHDAEEHLLETLAPHERLWEAAHIRQRCKNFSAGKRALVERLLAEKELRRAPLAEQRARVRKAAEIRYNHWENEYQQTGVRAARVAMLALALAAGLALVVLLTFAGSIDPFQGKVKRPHGVVAGVVAFGMIGGATSSVLAAVAGERRLPEQARDGPWHLARPLFGAAAGLVVVVAIASGLLGIAVVSPNAYFAWAAAGGFSEILLVGAMTRISDSADVKAASRKAEEEAAPPGSEGDEAGGGKRLVRAAR